eukprot:scpid8721/ scgid26367/ 
MADLETERAESEQRVRKSRRLKGIPPARDEAEGFEFPSLAARKTAMADARSVGSAESSRSGTSSTSRATSSSRRQAKIQAAAKTLRLEQEFLAKKFEQDKRLVELELAEDLARLSDEESIPDDSSQRSSHRSSTASVRSNRSGALSISNCSSGYMNAVDEQSVQEVESDSQRRSNVSLSNHSDTDRGDCVRPAVTVAPQSELTRPTRPARPPPQPPVHRVQAKRPPIMNAAARSFKPAKAGAASRTHLDSDAPHRSVSAQNPATRPHGPEDPTASARYVQNWVNSVPHSAGYVGIPQFQIKPLELPKFNGQQESYLRWRQRFMRLVDDDLMSTEDYKMARLREALDGGKAEELVSGILDGPGAYSAVLKELDQWFGGDNRELERQQQELLASPRISREDDTTALQRLAVKLRNVLLNLKTANVVPGRELYIAVSQKLPRRMLSRFLDRYDDQSCDAEVLSTWLLKQVHRAQQVDARLALPREAATASTRKPYDAHSSRAPSSGQTQHAFHASRGKPAETPNACFKCDGNHLLSQCPAFTAMSVRERWDLVKPTPLCICCLRPGHRSMSCSGSTCAKCNGKHHALLHFDKFSSNKLQQKQSNSSNSQGKVPVKEQVLHVCRSQPRRTSLPAISFMTVPVTVRNGSQETVCRALRLDPASTSTYIKAAVAEAIGLTGDPEPLQVTTLGGSQMEAMRRRAPVTIQSTDSSLTHQISAWVLPCVTADTVAVDWSQHQDAWTHLHDIPFPTMDTGDIGLLIGVDDAPLHTALEERRGPDDAPIARRTPLGWVCYGPTGTSTERSQPIITNCATAAVRSEMTSSGTEPRLDELVLNLWDTESIGVVNADQRYRTPAEREAEELATATMRHDGQRYEIGLPWIRPTGPNITSNRAQAEQRLRGLEKTLSAKPAIQAEYHRVLAAHLEKGYIRIVPEAIAAADCQHQWYLPHFPIVREDKSTSKVRVVFDAAAVWKGRSINAEMHTGPRLQNDIVRILLRFSAEPVALVADISEMFMQVGLKEEDRRFTRFLWRASPDDDMQVYEFNRLVFGLRASPYLAGKALLQTAQDFATDSMRSNDLVQVVEESFYVDDLLDSFQSASVAIDAQQQLTQLLQSGGFKLRKWLSNSTEVIESVPEADRAPQVSLDVNSNQHCTLPSSKTLGVMWLADKDVFHLPI